MNATTDSTSEIQRWSSNLYDSKARFVGDLAKDIINMLDIKKSERILDLGCGNGYLTEKLISKGATVVGADYSPELIAAAKERGIDARYYNGEELDFDNEFDGAFSNAAMHWMKKADAVASGVYTALKSGGRFVGEFAGFKNAEIIRNAIHSSLDSRKIDSTTVDPWYLPNESEYKKILSNAGFQIKHISLFDRPVEIDYHISDWIRTFGSPYLAVLTETQKNELLNEVSEKIKPELYDNGKWTVDYTRIRFHALKP